MDAFKNAWILGAGFSASLGGPLLHDLFSDRTEVILGNAYPNMRLDYSPRSYPSVTAVKLFRWGSGIRVTSGGGEVREPGLRQWTHAEEFLARLDRALGADNSPVHELITRFISEEEARYQSWHAKQDPRQLVEKVTLAAKHWMAAECCVFLRNADLESEQWQPYLMWAKSLRPDDVIINFNYDCVLETLIKEAGEEVNLHIVDPEDGKTDPDKTNVFKLHGSTDWRFNETENVFQISHADEARVCQRLDQIGIVTPGPGKKLSVGSLSPLWEGAMVLLGKADRVHFLGYRFPETDTEAMIKLLSAIKSGRKPSTTQARIVLGPDLSTPEVRRL